MQVEEAAVGETIGMNVSEEYNDEFIIDMSIPVEEELDESYVKMPDPEKRLNWVI